MANIGSLLAALSGGSQAFSDKRLRTLELLEQIESEEREDKRFRGQEDRALAREKELQQFSGEMTADRESEDTRQSALRALLQAAGQQNVNLPGVTNRAPIEELMRVLGAIQGAGREREEGRAERLAAQEGGLRQERALELTKAQESVFLNRISAQEREDRLTRSTPAPKSVSGLDIVKERRSVIGAQLSAIQDMLDDPSSIMSLEDEQATRARRDELLNDLQGLETTLAGTERAVSWTASDVREAVQEMRKSRPDASPETVYRALIDSNVPPSLAKAEVESVYGVEVGGEPF